MKKTALALMVVFAGISLTSCKKDRTCSCNVHIPADSSNGFVIPAQDSSFLITYDDISKKDARVNCENTETDANTTAQLFGGNASCDLE